MEGGSNPDKPESDSNRVGFSVQPKGEEKTAGVYSNVSPLPASGFKAGKTTTTKEEHYLEGKTSTASLKGVRMVLSFAAGEEWDLNSIDFTQASTYVPQKNPSLYCEVHLLPAGLNAENPARRSAPGVSATCCLIYMASWVVAGASRNF